MKPEDQFLKKMQPLSDRNQLLLDDNERFGGYNAKTIGFLLVGNTAMTIVLIITVKQTFMALIFMLPFRKAQHT